MGSLSFGNMAMPRPIDEVAIIIMLLCCSPPLFIGSVAAAAAVDADDLLGTWRLVGLALLGKWL